MQPMLENLSPVGRRIKIRTEFSGAGTAEEALSAAAVLFNQGSTTPIVIDVVSSADWAAAAQTMSCENHPDACRFKDIMELAPSNLRTKLEEEVEEKALWQHDMTQTTCMTQTLPAIKSYTNDCPGEDYNCSVEEVPRVDFG